MKMGLSDTIDEDVQFENPAGDDLYAAIWPERKKHGAGVSSEGMKKGKGLPKRSVKRGRLAFILDLATETVLHILSYLTPADILHLSYVDKELRAMLTSPSARLIWSAARANVPGLPECPPDFTESAYARYLFWKKCEVCGGTAQGLDTLPWLRIRLCTKCSKEHVVDMRRIQDLLWTDMALIPYKDRSPGFFTSASNPDADRHIPIIFVPTYESLLRKCTALAGNARKLTKFRGERLAFMTIVRDHAERLDAWLRGLREAKEQELAQIRKLRLEAIRAKLCDLGHDPKDMKAKEFQKSKHVNTAVELTEKAWQKARPELEGLVRRLKAERERRAELGMPEPPTGLELFAVQMAGVERILRLYGD